MYKDDSGDAEPQGLEMDRLTNTMVLTRNPKNPDILNAKDTRTVLRMALQVLFTSRADTGGNKSGNRFCGIVRNHRRIMATFGILETEFYGRIWQT